MMPSKATYSLCKQERRQTGVGRYEIVAMSSKLEVVRPSSPLTSSVNLIHMVVSLVQGERTRFGDVKDVTKSDALLVRHSLMACGIGDKMYSGIGCLPNSPAPQ